MIQTFIENNGKTYRPGSDTHLELRRSYVGCSELYKANGTLNMVKNIIKGKLYPQTLRIMPVTHGIHFEDNCEEYVKYLFNNPHIFKAPGSVLNNNIPNIACSADGLGYMNVINFDKYKRIKKGIEYVSITPSNINEVLPDFMMTDIESASPCLFEYKSPFSRKLKDGYISADYEYQIQGGMQIVDICNYACFFEGVFRQCTLGQLFEAYDYEYNYNIYDGEEGKYEIAKGIKLYFIKPEFFSKMELVIKILDLINDFENPHYETFGIDFGSNQYFKDFFVGLNESLYNIVNIPMFCKRDENFYNSEGQELDKEYICNIINSYATQAGYLGFVCWKLYDYQVLIQKRSNIITDKEIKRCESIMNCIKKIDNIKQIELVRFDNDGNAYLVE